MNNLQQYCAKSDKRIHMERSFHGLTIASYKLSPGHLRTLQLLLGMRSRRPRPGHGQPWRLSASVRGEMFPRDLSSFIPT